MFTCLQAKQGVLEVQGMWRGDVDHIDFRIFSKRLVAGMGVAIPWALAKSLALDCVREPTLTSSASRTWRIAFANSAAMSPVPRIPQRIGLFRAGISKIPNRERKTKRMLTFLARVP